MMSFMDGFWMRFKESIDIEPTEVKDMVDASKYRAQEFASDAVQTISPSDYPKGELDVSRVDEVEVKSGFSAGQTKLVVEVKDADGNVFTYWPNKTSIGTLVDAFGADTEKWLGKKFKLVLDTVRVRGQKRQALFAGL